MIKSCLQVTIICLDRSIGKSSDTAHGAILLLIYIGIIAYSIKFPLFNYPRVSMWTTLSFIGVFWLVLVNIMSWYVGTKDVWTLVIVDFWGIILIAGLAL
jgi:hypothetical protein